MADGSPALEYGGFTERSFTLLKGAGVCARFASIVLFLAMALTFIAATIGFTIAFTVRRHGDFAPWLIIASSYLVFALLYPVAVIALFRFATCAKRCATSREPRAVESAIAAQRFFLIYLIVLGLFLALITTGTFGGLLYLYFSEPH
jgi:hypothetical protein